MELPDTLVDPSVEHVEIPDEVIESAEAQPGRESSLREPPTREKLESNVSAGLKSVFDDEEAGDDVSTAVETPTADEKDAEESAADLKETSEEAKETTPSDTRSQAPTIPAAQARSLKAYGYTDEEIAESSKDPSFRVVAAKLHALRNKELSEYADAGRKARQAAAQPAQPVTPLAPKTESGLKPIDAAALKKKYGEDGLIDELTGPVNAAIKQINEMLPSIQESQKVSQSAATETIGRQIEQFFTGPELKSYKTEFGTMAEGLQEKQVQSRNKVLEFADALMIGARANGRQMSLDDALKAAFDSVSSGFKEQAVRSTITKQMKTRERGITLKPGGPSKPVDGKVRSRSDLEKKVSAGLRTVFHNS